MAISPSSSVQRARQELAARLREIRLDAGLTARALSARAGWHEAKTSRIESARQPLTDSDIRTWCQVCDAGGQAADLIAASRAADSMYIEWRRLQRTGLRRLQESFQPLFERTRLFRVYCPNVVPVFFQTPGYASALLSAISVFHGTADDVEDAVAARISRSRILHAASHRFAIVIEESVLRYRIGEPDTMAGQLGRPAHRSRPVPHLPLRPQEHRPRRHRRILQSSAHLVRVHRVDPRVVGEHGEQHGRIGRPGQHVVVR